MMDKLPKILRDALAGKRPEFQEEMAKAYLEADEDTQADILAFFESGGPEIIRQLVLRDQDGTPTANDLEKLL